MIEYKIWHPCSQMKDYEDFPPILVQRAEGAYIYDKCGKEYLDIISSWWCNLLGHNNSRINEAIINQLKKFEHVIFANFTHEPALNLVEKLSKLLPKNLARFFFSGDGSSAVEVALKLSFAYHQHVNPKKTKFVSLTSGYHGETIGALSLSDLGVYSKIYQPTLLEIIKIYGPDCYRCPYKKNRENCSGTCVASVERCFEGIGKEVSAVFVEPLLMAAAGMRIYPPIYLKKLRKLCDDYKIHLIFDEIATGFGRTGKMFALDIAEVVPDIICLSKGLTGGYLPMSITVASMEIFNAFYADYNQNKSFLHSHTYSGNPLAAAAANTVLDILESDRILEKAERKSKYFNNLVKETFSSLRFVGEIRNIGLINAIEIVENKITKQPFDASKRICYKIYREAINRGLILRPLGNCIYFNPPLTITEEEMQKAVNITYDSIRAVLNN